MCASLAVHPPIEMAPAGRVGMLEFVQEIPNNATTPAGTVLKPGTLI